MSEARARHILKRAGYAEGGALMKSIDRQVEDAGEVSRGKAIAGGKRDRMSVAPPDADDAIEWQRTHPNPDPSKYTTSHLPSDLKQRNQLPDEIAGSNRGGRIRKR